MNAWIIGRSLKRTASPQSKHSTANSTCQELMSVTMIMLRGFGEYGMKDLGDYHNLYLTRDVLLLSNIFKTFRTTCLEHCILDLTHFYTSPGLAWQACLRKTEVILEFLTDPDKLFMFE